MKAECHFYHIAWNENNVLMFQFSLFILTGNLSTFGVGVKFCVEIVAHIFVYMHHIYLFTCITAEQLGGT